MVVPVAGLAAINIGLSTLAIYQLNQLEKQLQAELDEAWAIAFPNGPGRANSSVFEQITRVEQLLIFHTNKTKPTTSSFGISHKDSLKQ